MKAFPNPEDVRVSLRDKYSALHQRLRHCVVKGTMHVDSTKWMGQLTNSLHFYNVKLSVFLYD